MEVIKYIKDYWSQLIIICGFLFTLYKIISSYKDAIKCSLRNDILEIYDRCKETSTISRWDLEAIKCSSELYFKLNGNSFVKDIVDRVNNFEIKD